MATTSSDSVPPIHDDLSSINPSQFDFPSTDDGNTTPSFVTSNGRKRTIPTTNAPRSMPAGTTSSNTTSAATHSPRAVGNLATKRPSLHALSFPADPTTRRDLHNGPNTRVATIPSRLVTRGLNPRTGPGPSQPMPSSYPETPGVPGPDGRSYGPGDQLQPPPPTSLYLPGPPPGTPAQCLPMTIAMTTPGVATEQSKGYPVFAVVGEATTGAGQTRTSQPLQGTNLGPLGQPYQVTWILGPSQAELVFGHALQWPYEPPRGLRALQYAYWNAAFFTREEAAAFIIGEARGTNPELFQLLRRAGANLGQAAVQVLKHTYGEE